MNWLKRRLRDWINSKDLDSGSIKMSNRQLVSTDSDSLSSSSEPLRISVYSASGGTIIESRTYDRQKDRTNTNLYIVNDGEDLGNELGKIITMASLSR